VNITNIPAPRVPFIDERTGLMAREWYRFFLNLFVLTGSGGNPTTLDDLQIGPPNQPDLAELLIQINQNIAPQYEDQSGDFLATLDAAQLMSMMARFDNAEAAIQGAYLSPIVQTGTIASYNLDEGTWTPNQGAGLTVVGAFSSSGEYTKIGRVVYVQGVVSGATSILVAAAGTISTNLPFTAKNVGSLATGTMVNNATSANSVVYASANTTTLSASLAIGLSSSLFFSITYTA
jgi:hypothetical protein